MRFVARWKAGVSGVDVDGATYMCDGVYLETGDEDFGGIFGDRFDVSGEAESGGEAG